MIPSGVDVADEVGDEDEPPFVLYAGRLSPEKGVLELVEAANGIPLVIVGDGPLRERVPGARGFVAHDELLKLYERAAVVAVPSYREGFGVVCAEAMAHARPVVASSVGGLLDLVADGETGIHVPPGDVGALRDALKSLLADRDLRHRLGEAGRERVRERFSWAAVTDSTIAAYGARQGKRRSASRRSRSRSRSSARRSSAPSSGRSRRGWVVRARSSPGSRRSSPRTRRRAARRDELVLDARCTSRVRGARVGPRRRGDRARRSRGSRRRTSSSTRRRSRSSCDVDLATYNVDANASSSSSPSERSGSSLCTSFGLSADLDRSLGSRSATGSGSSRTRLLARRLVPRSAPGTSATSVTFSFHPRKSITTGEGGMMTTQRDDLLRRALAARPRRLESTTRRHDARRVPALRVRAPRLQLPA